MPRAASKPKPKSSAGVPVYIKTADPTPTKHPPAGEGWVHEIKFDGYRIELRKEGRDVKLISRNELDWTKQFSFIAEAASKLQCSNAILDGEVAVLGKTGKPDFQALRRNTSSEDVRYYAFDLLWLDGKDLRGLPLSARKTRLKKLMADAPREFIYVDPLEDEGPVVYRSACQLGLEGIVSKKLSSTYRSGRTDTWLKAKCETSETFPIIAFVEKLGAKPRRIASLYVGRWEDKKLLYAGKVQSGFSGPSLRDIRERLDPLIVKKSPLAVPVKKPKATWVEPDVLAEVKFTGRTDDGLLREAVFKGLRDDVRKVVKAPRPHAQSSHKKPKAGVPRENILQLLPNAVVPSKQELEAYWRKVGKRALEHLGHRPLKLVRHTHGTTFYHKGKLPPVPKSIHQFKIEKREGGEGTRLWVDSLDGLLGLVSIGAVELHPWNATVEDIEHADRLVFDLDPGEGIEYQFVIDTALELRCLLLGEGLKSWPKVTGGKGVHLMVPVEGRITHDEARKYTRALASRLVDRNPKRYTVSAKLPDRPGKLFIDYLRNGRGTTAVGTYSPRARAGYPIAAPVTWTDVEHGIEPDAFTLRVPWSLGKTRPRNRS